MDRIIRIADTTAEGFGPNLVKKDVLENLRGKIVIFNPNESEIAKNLEIKATGVFGVRFR